MQLEQIIYLPKIQIQAKKKIELYGRRSAVCVVVGGLASS